MAQLDNVRHELFCRAMARGTPQVDAYEEAGFERASANASTLGKKPFIKARIDELVKERLQRQGKEDYESADRLTEAKAEVDATGTISPEWVLKELIENIQLARDANQFAASNKALELIGKEVGLFQDKPAGSAESNAEKAAADAKAKRSIPVDSVNKLLKGLGYDGLIDMKTLTPVKVPVKKLTKDNSGADLPG